MAISNENKFGAVILHQTVGRGRSRGGGHSHTQELLKVLGVIVVRGRCSTVLGPFCAWHILPGVWNMETVIHWVVTAQYWQQVHTICLDRSDQL